MQAHHVELGAFTDSCTSGIALIHDGETARRQQPLRLEFLAAQADHHHLISKVRVEGDIAQRADRDLCARRIDGHPAAVGVLQADHVVYLRVFGQQLGLDALHREAGDAGHALHGLGDRQDVARADRAVGIAVALEAALKR